MDWLQSQITLAIASNHIGFIQLKEVEYPKFNSSVLVTKYLSNITVDYLNIFENEYFLCRVSIYSLSIFIDKVACDTNTLR
jgi:hypothetical protein